MEEDKTFRNYSEENFEEYYGKLEAVLDEALKSLKIEENASISKEVDDSCERISDSYQAELRTMLYLFLSEINKISTHFVQTINNHKYEFKLEEGGMNKTQDENVTEMVKFLNKTVDVIEKSSLILQMDEIKESNSMLIESINHLLSQTKLKHINDVNDLTVFLADRIIN